MNNVVQLHSTPVAYNGQQLDLIRRTVAADCTPAEFDLFVEVARRAGLDPFRKQVMALVFNKDKPEKRRMVIVTGIDGFRAIADRSGTYSPDEDEPEFTYDADLKDPKRNPLGLVKAKVTIRKNGKPVVGVAYWDEFAPLKEVWKENPETCRREPCGEFLLDTSGQWGKMGRTMLAKCAEAQALRKAYPEDLSSLYGAEEMDQARATELTPSEIVDQHRTEERLARVGATGILFQLFPNSPLESIEVGKVFDRVCETIESFSVFDQIRWFESANQTPLREFWARAPSDALELKKRIEARHAALAPAAQ